MSNQELSDAEESKKLLESKLLPRPISRFQDQCKITVPEDQNPEEKKEEREETSPSLASKEHEIQQKDEKKPEEEEEENDGYRTPTSEEHKIPVLQECPPAPKKRRIESRVERKSSSAHFHEMKVFDTEFWLYSPIFLEVEPTIKKARRGDTK
ncbi:cyclin-dependent protein kinase inhibitor SMR2-like [Magnolia sinica]|uniref:cyclin-dependent protein kinase inhibitor SMR2-like n=1 Tax=Magnolia sinica TaxID=86752 RepID=UPI002657B512|nr:cyclin-dependent protein kinase inhibitor SMR2-like [Magnolia sinica]